jgi:hypothetical protein
MLKANSRRFLANYLRVFMRYSRPQHYPCCWPSIHPGKGVTTQPLGRGNIISNSLSVVINHLLSLPPMNACSETGFHIQQPALHFEPIVSKQSKNPTRLDPVTFPTIDLARPPSAMHRTFILAENRPPCAMQSPSTCWRPHRDLGKGPQPQRRCHSIAAPIKPHRRGYSARLTG